MMTPRKIPFTKMPFTKMSGLGNDFVIIDARDHSIDLPLDIRRQLADRKNPQTKGCDQILVIEKPQGNGDVFMRIYNADGREVEACGNGARALLKYLTNDDQPSIKKEQLLRIETLGGILGGKREPEIWVAEPPGKVQTERFTITMPPPRYGWQEIPLSKAVNNTSAVSLHDGLPPAFLVNVGNPHAVFFVEDDIDKMAKEYGPQLVNHPLFNEGANINFARIEKDIDGISLATWERGAGFTRACGTGACATAIATFHKGIEYAEFTIYPPYAREGIYTSPEYYQRFLESIEVYYNGGHTLTQKGPVAFEFEGEAEL